MTWFTAASVSVNNGQSIVSINTTADDIGLVQEESMIFINGIGPGWVKRSYLDGSGNKKLELYTPWEFGNQTNQPAKVIWTDGGLARYARILQEVGEDAVTFAEAMAQIISSTAPLLNIETKTAGTIPVTPYGQLVQQVQDLLATMGDFGVPLYDTDTKNQARTLLGLQPQLTAQPTIDLDFANNEHRVYEQYGLTKKLITEALTTTRASTATYNSPFGVAAAAANLPRIEFEPETGECLGLLCEEQRTNLVINSQFSGASGSTPPSNWNIGFGTGTTETEPSPIFAGAVRVKQTGTEQRAHYQQSVVNLAPNTTYTLSCYFAKGTNATGTVLSALSIDESPHVNANLSSAAIVPGKVNTLTFTTGPVGGAYNIRAGLGTTNNSTGTVIFERPQLEAGSFPTSYIPTTTSQVTRSRDTSYLTPVVATKKGTLFVDLHIKNLNILRTLLSLSVGIPAGTSNRFEIGQIQNGDIQSRLVRSDVSNSIASRPSLSNQRNKVALSFETDGELKLAVNGELTKVPCTTELVGTGMTLKIGDGAFGVLNSTIFKAAYIPRALSDIELQELTRL